MADTRPAAGTSPSSARGYEPEVPISVSPILDWPPRPAATVRQDRLFGTFHDGTPEAHARMRQRMKARRRARTGGE